MLFIALGVILITVGIVSAGKMWQFTSGASEAAGKIEGFEERVAKRHRIGKPHRRSVNYAPIFTFRDSEGREHRVTSSAAEGKSTYQVGQEVLVLYRTENPVDARINTFTQMWFAPMAFGTLGLVFSGLSFIVRRR